MGEAMTDKTIVIMCLFVIALSFGTALGVIAGRIAGWAIALFLGDKL